MSPCFFICNAPVAPVITVYIITAGMNVSFVPPRYAIAVGSRLSIIRLRNSADEMNSMMSISSFSLNVSSVVSPGSERYMAASSVFNSHITSKLLLLYCYVFLLLVVFMLLFSMVMFLICYCEGNF